MAVESPRPDFLSTDTLKADYLFLDLHPRESADFALVGAGREECSDRYRMQRDGFEYHAIEFVVGGSWRLTMGGESTVLRSGSIFAFGPKTEYILEAESSGGLVKYFLCFKGRRARQMLVDCGLGEGAVLQAREPRWIHELFDQLLDCPQLEPKDALRIGNRLLELILMRIGSDVWHEDISRNEGRESFVRCKAYIHEHYLELGSVAEVARGCHLDASYLSRLFKKYSKERPSRLLTRLKTQHAADLILRRRYSVKLAAEAVGFEDPYHFSRVFKRVHGVSPSFLKKGS